MLLIFDCDGVLVESELPALETLSTLMGELGHPMSVTACRDAFMGRHNDDIRRGIEARIGRPLPGGGDALRARILDAVLRDLQPIEGISETLETLDGPRCVASSSDRARIDMLLRAAGLDGYFGGHLFSGMDVPRGKPAPDLFLHAAATMGARPAECTVIEDSVTGVEAAIAAGMRVVGFTGGRHSDPGQAARLLAAGAGAVVAKIPDLAVVLRSSFSRFAGDEGNGAN